MSSGFWMVSSQIWSRHFWLAIFGRAHIWSNPYLVLTHIWSKPIFGRGHIWTNQIWSVPYLVHPNLVCAEFGASWDKGTFSKRILSQRTFSKDPLAKGPPKSKNLWLLRYLAHTQQDKHRLGQVVRFSEVLLRYLAHTQQDKH